MICVYCSSRVPGTLSCLQGFQGLGPRLKVQDLGFRGSEFRVGCIEFKMQTFQEHKTFPSLYSPPIEPLSIPIEPSPNPRDFLQSTIGGNYFFKIFAGLTEGLGFRV